MAEQSVVRAVPVNPCCALWKEKVSKLQQKCTKLEDGRTALRQGIGIFEQQISKMQAENLNLKKAYEEEKMWVNSERDEKVKESALRVALENEISSLKSEISSLQQKGGLAADPEEIVLLRARVSEGEKEIQQLTEHLEKDQMRAETEKKKAEAALEKANEALNTVKAEKAMAEKLADNEREDRPKESDAQVFLENEISALKSQILFLQQQASSGAQDVDRKVTLLQARISEGETEICWLKELLEKEKTRADSNIKLAEEVKKQANEALSVANAEKSRTEKMQTDSERKDKEISALKSQILLLQQQAGSRAQDLDKEVILLQARVAEGEAEIYRLKEFLEIEKRRADVEKKNAQEEKKKANEEAERSRAEKVQADKEREEKAEESAMQVSLEKEISALKSQIFLLQQGSGVQDVDKEVSLLQARVSEGDAEINQLKLLIDKDKKLADSKKKKAEAEKKKANEARKMARAEKTRADEERRRADIEGKKAEENRLLLHRLRIEINEARSKLVLETSKLEDARKRLEAEKQKVIKEKKHADSEMARAEEQKILAEKNRKQALEEKSRADHLSQQVEDDRKMIKNLQKEIDELVCFRKLVQAPVDLSVKHMNFETTRLKGGPQLETMRRDAGESKLVLDCLKCVEVKKGLKEMKQKVKREKMRADSEMRKADEQRKVAEACMEKAIVENKRAEQLTQELEGNRSKIEELHMELQELESSRTLVDPLVNPPEKYMSTRLKLLRKELKLEKMRVEHANQVACFEKGRNLILQNEIRRFKEDLFRLSNHLETLNNCFSPHDLGMGDLAKMHDVSKSQSLNLKRKILSEEPCQMHVQIGNKLLKPSCTDSDSSVPFKHMAPPLPISKGKCNESISGMDSKLEDLHRSYNRKMLKSSAINSSMASFSDRPLVGSQERGAFSVVETDKMDEVKSNSQLTISRLSGDVTEARYNNNIAAVVENSVRSPLRIDAAGHKAGHNKKRKRLFDAIGSIENLYSEGKKWHMQISENSSMLQDIIGSRMDKPLVEERSSLPDLQDDYHKKDAVSAGGVENLHLGNSYELGVNGVGEANAFPFPSPPANNVTGVAHACHKEIVASCRGGLGNFEELVGGDYMKLLNLDNICDEESYRFAIERPLSPTLPEIGFHSSETTEIDNSKGLVVGGFNNVLSHGNDNMVPSCSFDGINVEIDSNKLKVNTPGTCLVPQLQEKESVIDSYETLGDNENCKSQTIPAGGPCVSQLWDKKEFRLPDTGSEGLKISYQSNLESAHVDLTQYCVVFSDTTDHNSISKIFYATKTCIAQCSMLSQMDRVVQKMLYALLKVEDLSPKEKVCVFFSVFLQNLHGFALENFRNLTERDLILFFNSFVGQMHTAMADAETRSMFQELLNLDELLTLIEDFLIDRKVLVHSDVSSHSLPGFDPRSNIVLNDGDIMLSFQAASGQQLVAGATVLASLCAAVDHIGFVCEASYNILRAKKVDSSLLAILHVFAYICGSNYFTHIDYSLLMTVIKSLVTFLERKKLTDSTASRQPLVDVWLGFPSCTECPFSEGVVSVDVVVSLLMERLYGYDLSDVSYEDLMELVVFSNSENLSSKTGPNSVNGETHRTLCRNCNVPCCLHKTGSCTSLPTTVFHGTLWYLGDVLSLFELVASNMSWNWTFNNIVLQLLKMLESGLLEKSLPAVVILLGQLGTLGVDANGHGDTGVEILRDRLSAFLCQSSSSKIDLPIQFATVNALLGVISSNLEELIMGNTEVMPVSESGTADCMRKWFSLLRKEQQSLSFRLLTAGVPS